MQHNQQRPREAYNFAIVQQYSNKTIGWIGWGRPSDLSKGDYDFGYALHPAYWGRGYMSEALQAAINYMSDSLGATCVFGECNVDNQASARVMEKAGMQLVDQWCEQNNETGEVSIHLRFTINIW
ncbi:MAG: GNAT family N-acetyltransferase [Chloroflexota bacterium]